MGEKNHWMYPNNYCTDEKGRRLSLSTIKKDCTGGYKTAWKNKQTCEMVLPWMWNYYNLMHMTFCLWVHMDIPIEKTGWWISYEQEHTAVIQIYQLFFSVWFNRKADQKESGRNESHSFVVCFCAWNICVMGQCWSTSCT